MGFGTSEDSFTIECRVHYIEDLLYFSCVLGGGVSIVLTHEKSNLRDKVNCILRSPRIIFEE